MIKYHIEGGVNWMVPLSLLLLINIGLVAFALFSRIQKKQIHPTLLESIKQVGGLALAWGVFSTVVGLFQIFDALAHMEETLPFNVIMGGLRVGFITAVYGMIIFLASQVVHFGLKLWNK